MLLPTKQKNQKKDIFHGNNFLAAWNGGRWKVRWPEEPKEALKMQNSSPAKRDMPQWLSNDMLLYIGLTNPYQRVLCILKRLRVVFICVGCYDRMSPTGPYCSPSGGRTSRVKAPADLVLGEDPLPGSQTAYL